VALGRDSEEVWKMTQEQLEERSLSWFEDGTAMEEDPEYCPNCEVPMEHLVEEPSFWRCPECGQERKVT
jgi:uncharacterized protein with PIN domain